MTQARIGSLPLPLALALAATLGLAGCGGGSTATPARLAPAAAGAPLGMPGGPEAGRGGAATASFACAQRLLADSPVMAEPAPIAQGWRLRLRVWSSPPAGWIDKGSLVHDGVRFAYLPDGATRGLADDDVRAVVEPIVETCR